MSSPPTNEEARQLQKRGQRGRADRLALFLFRPSSDAASDWLTENTDEEAQWFGGALAVEPRYAQDLAQSLLNDGWSVD